MVHLKVRYILDRQLEFKLGGGIPINLLKIMLLQKHTNVLVTLSSL